MFEHLYTDSPLTGIHHPLRGNERHNAAIPDRIQTFQEEIVVDGLGGGTAGIIAGSRIFGVKHRHIPERDMYNTFNMGLGLIMAIPKEQVGHAMEFIIQSGERAYVVGSVVKGGDGVDLV